MKNLLSILIAALIGIVATYFIVSKKNDSELRDQQARFAAEKSHLEEALLAAQNQPAKIEHISISTSTTNLAAKVSPQKTLDRLLEIKPGPGVSRSRAIRQVVFHLESLFENGTNAISAIRTFLARHADIDYAVDDAPGMPSFWTWRRGQELRTDFVLPPSLRLGLVDVLHEIGGEDAEVSLALMLNTTGRGVEVAYVARVLDEMSPGKYRELAIAAAKELLANPLPIERPTRLDENARSYLFTLLKNYNDTSFIPSAQAALIRPEGRVDLDALNYLTGTLKDQAMPDISRAYRDTRITNRMEKVNLVNFALNYVGSNNDANQMFNELIANDAVDPRMRAFSIMLLAGGEFGTLKRESPTDPALIKSRLDLLNGIMTKDLRVSQALAQTRKNLQNLLEGKLLEKPHQ